MLQRFANERADKFQDLRCVLNSFKITNVDEIVGKFKRERMLKITALQIRELLWNPHNREKMLNLIMNFDPDLEGLIENSQTPILETEEGISYQGIVIKGFRSDAEF